VECPFYPEVTDIAVAEALDKGKRPVERDAQTIPERTPGWASFIHQFLQCGFERPADASSSAMRCHNALTMSFMTSASCQRSDNSAPSGPVMA
jgi:hypothetical protein